MPRAAALLQEGEAAVDRFPGQVALTCVHSNLRVDALMRAGACAACRLRSWSLRAAAARLVRGVRRAG